MVTLRMPTKGRIAVLRATPIQKGLRDFEATLYDLPFVSRYAGRRSLRRRIMRPFNRRAERQRTVALFLGAGTAFIAMSAIIAGIAVGYRRRQNAAQGESSQGEESGEEFLTETLVMEFERPAATK